MSTAATPVDLRPDHLGIVRDILRRHVPDREVLAFGSRATWTAKEYSDLDLAILGDEPLPLGVTAALADDFSESDLPFKVDLIDWARLDESFRDIIRRSQVVVQNSALGPECNASNREWPIVTIEAISEKVAMGPFGSSIKVETFVPDGVPIISGQHLRSARVDDSPGFNFIAEDHAQRLANANVQRGDIIFTHAGNIGHVAYIPENSQFARYVVSQRQFYMRCDLSKAIPEFVTAYFRSPEGQHKLLANASQVGVPSIAQPVTYLRTIEIPLPSLPEQRAIAHILGTLDDKIELNREMNETLEATVRSIFKDWFVDFGPTRAKMEGRAAYLPPEIWNLFPDVLDDEGKPEGWEMKSLGTFISLTKGRSYKSVELQDSKVALVTLKSFKRGGGYRSDGLKPYIGKYNPEQIINPGELVISLTDVTQTADVVGKPAIVLNDARYDTLVASLDVGIIRSIDDRVGSPFIAHLLQTEQFQNHAYSHCTGTTVLHLGKDAVPSYRFSVPSKEIVESFDKVAVPISSQVAANAIQNNTLVQTRDTLLPRLISGEIRLKEARAKVDEAIA